MRFLFASISFLVLEFFMAGCQKRSTDTDFPDPLRIGLLPEESRTAQIERYGPLFAYLEGALNTRCEFVHTEDYDSLVQSFGERKIDLAFFGGLTFVQAKQSFDADPLIMRDIDTRFTSYFITRANHPGQKIEDFGGQSFAFGSPLSTSGHLMPRHFLLERGIDPDSFFQELLYSGAHDRTIEWIREGTAQLGAVNGQILMSMLENDPEAATDLRIIWETPPYSNYVWTVQADLSERNKTRIRDAFLLLSPEDEQHRSMLERMGANGFFPAEADDFADLETLALRMGIIPNAS